MLDYIDGDAHRLGAASRWSASRATASSSPTSTRLLAADGHAARQAPARGAVGDRARAVEDVVSAAREFWRGRRVLVTGHTGFKGTWLCLWLQPTGRRGHGLRARAADRRPVALRRWRRSSSGSIRSCGRRPRPGRGRRRGRALGAEVVFHLAAQPLVRRSLRGSGRDLRDQRHGHGRTCSRPCARAPGVRASWSCHQRQVLREPRVGRGATARTSRWAATIPTSSSKGCAELVTAAYRRSFFSGRHRGRAARHRRAPATSSAAATGRRTGWCPTCMRAFAAGEPVVIRNPHAVRPWQHVLEPLAGYLPSPRRLCERPRGFARGLELRPVDRRGATGGMGRRAAQPALGRRRCAGSPIAGTHPHEARLSAARLHEGPRAARLDAAPGARRGRCDWTVDWYTARWRRRGLRRASTLDQIERFEALERDSRPHDARAPCRSSVRPAAVADLRRPRAVAAGERLPASRTALDAMEPFYPLHALVCGECFLVQLERVRDARSTSFSDYAVLLVVLRHLARPLPDRTPRRWSSASALGAELAGRGGREQRRLPAAVLRRSAACRCSASSRPPTSPQVAIAQGHADAGRASSARETRTRAARATGARPT